MSRYLAHAVTPPLAVPPSSGLGGRPLRWLGAGTLGIWATEWEERASLDRSDAFAHHALVEAICDAGPCLPVRFGTWLADGAAADRSITAAAGALATALERLAGRREVAVTLLWADAPATEGRGRTVAPSGRAFLERRRAAHAHSDARRASADALLARLLAVLAVERADVRHETCPSGEIALSLSLLARRGEADALKARATEAVAALPGIRGVVSGPWPPYSFTEALDGR